MLADLMLEVSKLINNFTSTAAPFPIPDQDAYTKDHMNKLVIDSNKSLKNHLMKTIFINKLAPTYKQNVWAKETTTFPEANNLAVALWRRRYPEGVPLKPKSIFTVESEFGLDQNSDLSQEEREICINAISQKRNNSRTSSKTGFFPTTVI